MNFGRVGRPGGQLHQQVFARAPGGAISGRALHSLAAPIWPRIATVIVSWRTQCRARTRVSTNQRVRPPGRPRIPPAATQIQPHPRPHIVTVLSTQCPRARRSIQFCHLLGPTHQRATWLGPHNELPHRAPQASGAKGVDLLQQAARQHIKRLLLQHDNNTKPRCARASIHCRMPRLKSH